MGLTPACAGKTHFQPPIVVIASAHPRVCGENLARRFPECPCDGSPPRVRGKPESVFPKLGLRGLTPACAGKTGFECATHCSLPAHPRVCGENKVTNADDVFDQGSPPRVRGKPGQWRAEGQPGRLTPACAGKTTQLVGGSWVAQAHPRVCGENTMPYQYQDDPVGSPPRVRGKRPRTPSGPRCPRLTPACAGKTSAHLENCSVRSAHPRVCGENEDAGLCVSAALGSPPRVRGKHRPS